jgi:type IV pilus assembly protein PilM
MAFSMFSAQTSPIAVDFGATSLKLLQTGSGDRPALQAATELRIPESILQDQDAIFHFYGQQLPTALNAGSFKGRKAITAIPSALTFVQHMQVGIVDGLSQEDAVKAQLQLQTGCAPQNVVVRTIQVPGAARDGSSKQEMICMAAGHDTVMRYVNLLKRCKLEVVGMHTEILAMVRAFDHLTRRATDAEVCTMFVDMGWGGTRVAITHGGKVVFARYVSVGGRHFDQLIAKALKCDMMSARGHRLALDDRIGVETPDRDEVFDETDGNSLLSAAVAEASTDERRRQQGVTAIATERRRGGPAEFARTVDAGYVPRIAASVDVGELLDTMTDELSMCLRYHRGLFPGRQVDRIIFLGGEARQTWLCRHIVKELDIPAQLGDPLARLDRQTSLNTPGLELDQPQPGWAVACGLCSAPADL